MKNYLVITLGTREIQLVKSAIEPSGFEIITEIRKEIPFTYVQPIGKPELRISARGSDDFPDFYTISPRTDGEIMLKNWGLFRSILDWPLIRPVLQHLKEKNISIDIIMLVYTDQDEAFMNGQVKKRSYINNDTVFFAEMIERLIQEDDYFKAAKIDPFGRFDSVADMAIQYEGFRKIKDELISDEEVNRVYLFPQGGIDQINQALTLRLIETFQGRVVYLQNPEGHAIQELDFPRRFVEVLNRQKIQKHLQDYDFSFIDKSLTTDKTVCHLAQYAARRLSLQHNQLKVNTDVLLKENRVNSLFPEFQKDLSSDESKLLDLYLSAKISSQQNKYTEFLWKIFTVNESLLKVKAEALIGDTARYRIDGLGHDSINPGWVDKLNRSSSQLVPYFELHGIGLSNPYRKAYAGIFACLSADDLTLSKYMRVADKLESLARKRHGLAHKLGTTTVNEINQALGMDYKLEGLTADLDTIFGITGFGIYDTISAEIKSLL